MLSLFVFIQKASPIAPEVAINAQSFLTPIIKSNTTTDLEPPFFATSNSLIHKTDALYFAQGEPLIITGKVYDVNYAPIQGVKIKIWQRNAFGEYNYAIPDYDSKYDKYFENSGTAITNVHGEFGFETIIPKPKGTEAPYINVQIEYDKETSIETRLYLASHPLNAADPTYSKLTQKERDLITAKTFFIDNQNPKLGKRAEIEFTLNINQFYKKN